ncbi:CPBP family intramembrane glutamic endopeptidase [Streptomyces sp. NPDC021096]|uniref:CPBP family intramembrane glutamic endopeptidase n=1 Tax=Streptomyces sp. NPDC021096 TaxID=3154792 RepID=UPI0033E37C91
MTRALGGRMHRLLAKGRRAIRPLAYLAMWFAAVLGAQAVREAFVFVPGFVPWDGESPRDFFVFTGGAACFTAVAVLICVGHIPVRSVVGRFVDGLGLRPASRRQAVQWAVAGLATAAALWAGAELVDLLPGLISVPDAEDPRSIAVADTSTLVRFCYGLIAPAPLEELFYRAPLLALWLALLTAQHRGNWTAHRWLRWSLMAAAITISTVWFAAGHHLGGSVNVAHAALAGVILTAAALRQRSLVPALLGHGLYDAYAFAWA